jgi:NAD(P)-dependent dehydrogenase (short-subunit alcohol dehydrogenase family)
MDTEMTPERPGAALLNPLSLFDVSGKSAIVTGASGAFGRAVAIALGALGCRLLLAGGSADQLARVAEEVVDAAGEVSQIVRRPNTLEDAKAIIAAGTDAFGTPDMLIVASGYNHPAMINDMALEDWQAVMDANVRGPWLMAKEFGAALGDQGRGKKVLFVSSVRGRLGNAVGYSAYCPSKGAVDALTRVLATEWGARGITVNAIAPTVFRSNLTGWIFADDEKGRAARARNLAIVGRPLHHCAVTGASVKRATRCRGPGARVQ